MQEEKGAESALDYVESNKLVKEAMDVVYNNEDNFNYEFIEGEMRFEDGVAYFIDIGHELRESNMEDRHAYPLGVESVVPFRKDYQEHPKNYEYLLCRHGKKFWLSVIQHSPEETTAERYIESAYAVIREYTTAIGIQSAEDMKERIERTRSVLQNRRNKYGGIG